MVHFCLNAFILGKAVLIFIVMTLEGYTFWQNSQWFPPRVMASNMFISSLDLVRNHKTSKLQLLSQVIIQNTKTMTAK